MKKLIKLIAGAAVFGIVAGSTFQGVELISRNMWKTQAEEESSASSVKLNTTNVLAGEQDSGTDDVAGIAEQVLPSIVAIDVTARTTEQTLFGPQVSEGTGSASGIIIAEKNGKMYIATNNHVVEDATKVTIIFHDESKAEAVVKGTDSSSDLAVVEVDTAKLSADTKKNIKIAAIGDSDATKVGERAIAIGNALGYGTSVTVGYVSAKDREIGGEDTSSVKLIQTDAAINPGNSGGALVNSRGEVIGINSAKFASEQIEGMGFAIPMKVAEPILEDLMNQKKVEQSEQAWLGISGRDVTSEYTENYGIPEGIYVAEVTDGSPAQKAGIRQGYVITALNGKEIKTMAQLQEKLAQCRAGQKGVITVQVSDNGSYNKKELTVTFGKKAAAE